MNTWPIIRRLWADEGGATAIEYSLICAIMFLAIVAISATGGALKSVYDTLVAIITALGG